MNEMNNSNSNRCFIVSYNYVNIQGQSGHGNMGIRTDGCYFNRNVF